MNKHVFWLLLLSLPVSASTDYQCMSDCTKRYSRAYCTRACTVDGSPGSIASQQVQPNPVGAYLEGRRQQQEELLRQRQMEQLEADTRRVESETARLREKSTGEAMAEYAIKVRLDQLKEENERLKTENELLRSLILQFHQQKQQPTDGLSEQEKAP